MNNVKEYTFLPISSGKVPFEEFNSIYPDATIRGTLDYYGIMSFPKFPVQLKQVSGQAGPPFSVFGSGNFKTIYMIEHIGPALIFMQRFSKIGVFLLHFF